MSNISTYVICLIFTGLGIWIIQEGQPILGWVSIVFFGGGGVFLFFNDRRDARSATEYDARQLESKKQRLAEAEELQKQIEAYDVDVSDDHVEVWKSVLVEEGADWVVFENGTLVVCDEDIPAEESALEIIKEFSETVPGTYLGDFSVYPRLELGIWIISYPMNQVFNYMPLKGCSSESAAGMIARTIRADDANQRNILYTHIVEKRR
jgi:hypothetical protein